MPELTVREYQPGDEVEILETFNRIFAAVDPGFRPRSLASWRWQFQESPSGSTILVAVTPEGKVAGQLANLLQRVRLTSLDGRATREVTFSQAVDSMSDPALRQGLKRESLQARLGNAYAEQYAGEGEGQHALLWGAPVPAAWRVGKRFIRYEVIRTQLALEVSPVELRVPSTRGVEVEVAEAFPDDTHELFERAAVGHGAIAVRDPAWLAWRDLRHPEHSYRVALARRGGTLAGYAIVRRGSFATDAERLVLCDWLVPEEEPDAARALLAWIAEEARRVDCDEIVTVFSDRRPPWRMFQSVGFRAAPTPYAMVGREGARGYDMRWLNANWYYTLGDTDLV